MDMSWRPTLKAPTMEKKPVSFYRQAPLPQKRNENHAVDTTRRTWGSKASGGNPADVMRTGRTWGSKTIASAAHDVIEANQRVHSLGPCDMPRPPSPSMRFVQYEKEQFLFMRQLMLNAQELDTATSVVRRCVDQQELKERATVEKRSAVSVCSTTDDTLSNLSDDNEAHSSSLDMQASNAPSGMRQSKLRADASEFVPNSLLLLAETDCITSNASVADVEAAVNVIGFGPLLDGSLQEFHPPHCFQHESMEKVSANPADMYNMEMIPAATTHDDIVDIAANQRCNEWRQFCGLEPLKCDMLPQGFAEHGVQSCSLGDMFLATKPGDLFMYGQDGMAS